MICLASIKNHFDHAELHVRFRDIRPYSSEVVSLVEEVTKAEGVRFHIPGWQRISCSE